MNIERFEFRNIRIDEADQAAEIEQICFPPNEACSREHMMDRVLHAPDLFPVAVDKDRGQGLARELVEQYAAREHKNGRQRLLLTCLKEKVGMYQKFGFWDRGIADSIWGGKIWNEMVYFLEESDIR